MEEILWQLFKKTGNIKYFLMIKELGSVEDEDKENRGNSSRGTKL